MSTIKQLLLMLTLGITWTGSLALGLASCSVEDIDDAETAESGDVERTVIDHGGTTGRCCQTDGSSAVDTSCIPRGWGTSDPQGCAAGRTLTRCMGCNDQEHPENDGWHSTFPGSDILPSSWECRGLSWRVSTGRMIEDNCMGDRLGVNNADGCQVEDIAVPMNCDGTDTSVTSNMIIDWGGGEIGRMCCRPETAQEPSDTDYVCMPRETSAPCNVDGYTSAAYCLPCPGASISDWDIGGWELRAHIENNDSSEAVSSLDCSDNPSGDGVYDPPGPVTACRIAEYECGGILVGTGGTLLKDHCANWP